MTNEANSIKTARRHYLSWETPLDQAALGDELLAGNDRSAVISVAALTDTALELALAQHLQLVGDEEHDRAFSTNGPLATFSSRIDMAYWLKLIDATVRGQLHDIRNLRNICAHSRLPISFSDVRLANVARRILAPTGSFKPHGHAQQGVRKGFVAEGLYIHSIILFGREEALRMLREAYTSRDQKPPF